MPQINANFNTSDRIADWLKVVCNMNNEAIRNRVAFIVNGHFKRFKKPYIDDVDYHARRYGLNWEQMFVLFLKREMPKDDGYSEQDIEWAKQQSPIAIKSEEMTGLGVETQTRTGTELPTVKHFLERFSGDNPPSDLEIVKLANEFEVAEELLLDIRDCLQRKREVQPNGAS